MLVDLLLDLSAVSADDVTVGRVIDSLADSDGQDPIMGRRCCILPPGAVAPARESIAAWHVAPAEDALAASSIALEAAARAERPLLTMLGPIQASMDSVSTLLRALALDPMFGFVIARVACADGGVARLDPALGGSVMEQLPPSALGALPEIYRVPEIVGRCFLLGRQIVANLGPLDSRFRTTVGAWLHYLCRARHVGFQGVVANRAVVSAVDCSVTTTASPIPDDYWSLHRQYPDTAYARRAFRGLPAHEYEALLGRAFSPKDSDRLTLLIDARDMPPGLSEVAAYVLGLLDGLAGIASGWHITVLVNADAMAFHRLAERYSEWTIVDRLPECLFSISLKLCEPSNTRALVELHRLALLNDYLLLDPIAWDVARPGLATESAEAVWQLIAEYADGILYGSESSRRRFAMRFQPDPSVRHRVCHVSCHPADYPRFNSEPSSTEGYLLVLGHHPGDKAATEIVELLATAFPFQAVLALNCGHVALSNVTCVPGDDLSDRELARLHARASIVVLPSFHEGIGLSVVRGLHYGRVVVARQSSLLEEVAARCRAGGRLYAFSDPIALLQIVARLVHGNQVPDLPLSSALGTAEEPTRWSDVARTVLEFGVEALQRPARLQWLRRERSWRALFPSSRSGVAGELGQGLRPGGSR